MMNPIFLFALLASVMAGDPPRLPWHLNVLVERGGKPTLLTADYRTIEECVEDLTMLYFTPAVEGVTLVTASCDRDPETI